MIAPIETAQQDCTTNGVDSAIRKLLKELVYKKRQPVAEHLRSTGVPVSVAILNSYTRTDKGARLPAILIQPLCELFGDDRLLLLLMRPHLRKLLALGQAAAEVLDVRAQKQLVARSTRLRTGKKSKVPTKGACGR